MTPQSAASTPSSFLKAVPAHSHIHVGDEFCPTCEQEIPAERLKEISGKIVAKQRERDEAITLKLQQQFALDKDESEAKAKADLELERQNSTAREAAAREEARAAAETAAAEKLAESERIRQELQNNLQRQLDEAVSARAAADEVSTKLQAQLADRLAESEAALSAVKAEAKTREIEIRKVAQDEAQAAVAKKLAEIEHNRAEAESALQLRIDEVERIRIAAERKGSSLQLQLDELRTDSAAAIASLQDAKDNEVARVKADAAAAALRIRQEATETATALMHDRLVAQQQAVIDAQALAFEAESKLAKLSDQHEAVLNERLVSQREILEQAKEEALNAERSKAFLDSQKLQTKVNELQRQLDNKTAEELGEGAEVNLYEWLRKEFPDDRIERVAKGSPGADIYHVVVDHGRECGIIVYDSKNHKSFRTEHVAKLAKDQIDARAEHAILSLHKFPAGRSQLHMQDGVLLANPARVVAVVTLIRRHMVHAHTLRLSNTERDEKTAKLYSFITSERCKQLLDQVEKQAEDLLELQAKEVKWHKNNWERQGEAYRLIQRAKVDLDADIYRIIGTATNEADDNGETQL